MTEKIKLNWEPAGFKQKPQDIYQYLDIRSGNTEFDKLLLDDQVSAGYAQIIEPIVAAETSVTPASDTAADVKAADLVRDTIEHLRFDELIAKMCLAIHYGFSGAEVIWTKRDNAILPDDIKVRDRSRFDFSADGITIDNTIPVTSPYFWIFTANGQDDDRPYGLGKAHALVHLFRFKRAAHKFWLRYLDKFSQPTILGRLPAGADEDYKSKMLQTISMIASNTGVVAPEGAKIELLEAARSGSVDYESFITAINRATSKAIVGQTMTTDNGSSYSQAKVHHDVLQSIISGTANAVMESFTDTVARWITEYNVPGATPPKCEKLTRVDDIERRIEMDKKLAELGFMPTEDYIHTTYGEHYTQQAQAELAEGDPFPDQTELDGWIDGRDYSELAQGLAKVTLDDDVQEIFDKTGDLTDDITASLFVAENWGRGSV